VIIWPTYFLNTQEESPTFLNYLTVFVLIPIVFVHSWFSAMLSFSQLNRD
jgi:hypothetical protein